MQNQQLSDVKGKELVAAGHAFAKAIGMDTPLIEIAKMMAELATRLDCALVRGDELQNNLDAVTIENIELIDSIGFIGDQRDTGTSESLIREQNSAMAIEVPATVASMKSLRVDKTHAAIKAQRDALGAENAGLKFVQKGMIKLISEHIGDASLTDAEMKTPATDAYLKSLRAEGVDYVAEAIGAKCAELKVGSKDWKALKSIVFTLGDFAAQLRAGKDGE
ncbi:TPA: hypothetical protein ACQZB3_000563 [Escherichia coli]